nr:uncharacterized protein LOC116424124 [Nomia melanderi]
MHVSKFQSRSGQTRRQVRGMRSRLLKSSLLKLMMLVPLTLDNVVQLTANVDGQHGHHHHRPARRINLPRAVNMIRSFTCVEPQSRAYNLRDLMQNVQQNTGDSVMQPAYIVLKRCDVHSGCCTNPDRSCKPVVSSIYYEEVETQILSLETKGIRKQWITVEQHGNCSCEITTTHDRRRLEHLQPNVTLI